ncbi:hypothetical protein HDZ31DRAFT_49829, partial [Schizophyllum fasciatum]
KRTPKAKISPLDNMPLDIMYEIFAHCSPHALLQLSRTSKHMRNTLVNRNVAWIWRKSLSHLQGLPPLLDAMCELELAHILFDEFCFFCSERKAANFVWMDLTKICSKCLPIHYPEEDDVVKRYRHTHDLIRVEKNRLHRIVPYLRRDKSGYEAEYKDVPAHRDDMDRWFDAKERHASKIREKRKPFRDWWEIQDKKRKEERAKELKAIRNQRFQYIYNKLCCAGWFEELHLMKNYRMLLEHRLLTRAQRLTDATWPQIEDEVVRLMQQLRDQRIKEDEEEAIAKQYEYARTGYDAFARDESIDKILPRFEDIAGALSIEKSVQEPEAILVRMKLNETRKWRETCDAELIGLISKMRGAPACKADLTLARTQFSVKVANSGRIFLSYPAVLDSRKLARGVPRRGQDPVLIPWTTKYVSVDRHICERARQLIELAGADPDKMTTQEMDALDPWYERKAGLEDDERCLMRWREALAATRHRVVNLVLSSEEDAAIARNIIKHSEWKPDLSDCRMARCLHCGVCTSSAGDCTFIYVHLKDKHNITIPTPADFEVDAFGPRHQGLVTLMREA